MDLSDLKAFRDWFYAYTRTFYTEDEEDQRNITLKVRHTERVCENIRLIVRGETFPANGPIAFLAEAAALFHDVGRFPQYARYKTFRDHISVNHGRLGADVLRGQGVLASVPDREREMISVAVQFHNAYGLPSLSDPDALLLLRLVRDADKLDIWRIFLGFCEGGEEEVSQANLGLPDIPGYSSEVLSCLFEGKSAVLTTLQSVNDFRLLQLSWVFDVNFETSMRLLLERNYIQRLVSFLPQTEEILKAEERLLSYAGRRLKGAGRA